MAKHTYDFPKELLRCCILSVEHKTTLFFLHCVIAKCRSIFLCDVHFLIVWCFYLIFCLCACVCLCVCLCVCVFSVHCVLAKCWSKYVSQTHAQSHNIIGHLRTHHTTQSRNIIGSFTHPSSSHNTTGLCLLYNVSHTAVSLVLYAVDKGLCG